jgi:hypothetical protein
MFKTPKGKKTVVIRLVQTGNDDFKVTFACDYKVLV